MRHEFLVLAVKMVKIGMHLRDVIAKWKPGYHFFGPPLCIYTWLCTVQYKFIRRMVYIA